MLSKQKVATSLTIFLVVLVFSVLFGLAGLFVVAALLILRKQIVEGWGRAGRRTRHFAKFVLDTLILVIVPTIFSFQVFLVPLYLVTMLTSMIILGVYKRGTSPPDAEIVSKIFAAACIASLSCFAYQITFDDSFKILFDDIVLIGLVLPSLLIFIRTLISESVRLSIYTTSNSVSKPERAILVLTEINELVARIYVELALSKGFKLEEVWVIGPSRFTYLQNIKVRSLVSLPRKVRGDLNLLLFTQEPHSELDDSQKSAFLRVSRELGYKTVQLNPPTEGLGVKPLTRLDKKELWEEVFRDRREFKLNLDDNILNKEDLILVTGGAGSIGSTLVRLCVEAGFQNVHVVDNSEIGLYQLEESLVVTEYGRAVTYHFVDIKNNTSLQKLLQSLKPTAVFHAAASKHVHIVESNPDLAFETNVVGTHNLLRALPDETLQFTLVSTDKAVYPENFMGATKRMAEVLVSNAASHRASKMLPRRYAIVRFGNVFGSSGSAPLKFIDQIATGNRVTVTDARMERYFMSIYEACYLVAQVSLNKDENCLHTGGVETYVLDMGKPVKILDLVNTLVELSGKKIVPRARSENEIEIKITGSRPGEKLFEELSHGEELVVSTIKGVNKVSADNPDLTALTKEFSGVLVDRKRTLEGYLSSFDAMRQQY
jgi:FlaA1/EpsC-like NDP-sugar epimerase